TAIVCAEHDHSVWRNGRDAEGVLAVNRIDPDARAASRLGARAGSKAAATALPVGAPDKAKPARERVELVASVLIDRLGECSGMGREDFARRGAGPRAIAGRTRQGEEL